MRAGVSTGQHACMQGRVAVAVHALKKRADSLDDDGVWHIHREDANDAVELILGQA